MTIIIYWARFTDIIYRYISAVFRWFIRKRDRKAKNLPDSEFGCVQALSLILHSNGNLQYEAYLKHFKPKVSL